MKIALQISGEFRALHFSAECLNKYILSVFPEAEINIFVHTWWREQTSLGTWQFEGRGDWHKNVMVFDHGTGLALFKPSSYFLEKYEDRHDLKALPRAYSMYYSIKRANEARKEFERLTGIHYDFIIRYRTDCIINENLYEVVRDYIKDYIEQKKSFLCIPQSKVAKRADGPVDSDTEGICDWFAIGTGDAMDVYCGTYDTFIEIGLPILPESMLALQLKSRGITKETILKRPLCAMFLVEGNGQIRGL